jgi:Zn-dependent M28 family amino/carboxypeptidase
VLASHYDTKRAPFRFVGANDGASSTAAVLELGRALSRAASRRSRSSCSFSTA